MAIKSSSSYLDELRKNAGSSASTGNSSYTSPTTSISSQTGVRPTTTTTAPVTGTGSTNPYYEMARKQNYTALLDKEIQLESARQNALKHTNAQLAAQGLHTQGYGASVNTGVNNSYLNALAQASRDYQASSNELDLQEYQEQQANANDIFQSVTTMASQASDMETLNSLFVDYGYGSVDSEGNFAFGSKPEGMSDNDWNQLKYYYKLQTQAIENSNSSYNGTAYANLEQWKNATFVDEKGVSRVIKNNFKHESDVLWTNINAGKYEYDTVIGMESGDGDKVYVKIGRAHV